MNGPPLISVIIPVLNAEPYLAAALASVTRQQWPRVEIVIVDSSTDGTSAAVRAAVPGATYVYQEKRGVSAARNAGFALSRGDWVTFLDVDDEWQDGALTVLAAALVAQPAALFALGKTRFDPPTVEPWVSPNLGAGLYRREVFTRVGLFDEARPLAEDVEWFLRVREQGVAYATVDQITLCYRRQRSDSLTAGRGWREFGLEAMIRASLARRRQAGGGQAGELNLLSGSKDDPRASTEVKHGSQDRATD